MYMGLVMSGRKKIHAAEPLLLKPIVSEVEMAIEELKRHESQHN